MYVVMGGTGHIGSAVARTLIAQGERVTIVTRDAAKAPNWAKRDAAIAEVDLSDAGALREIFRRGRRAFLLSPPADMAGDTDSEERRTIATILAALEGSGLEKVVAESAYGAQPGERCGDLSTLYTLEEGLCGQPIPADIVRAAYYFTNLDALLEPARGSGKLPTMYPEHVAIPMAAPIDIGRFGARLLAGPIGETGLHFVEGPARYSFGDVAAEFAKALDRPISVAVTPRAKWIEAFRAQGFSEAAAQSYARMTAVSIAGDYDMPVDPVRGSITLEQYVARLVAGGDGAEGEQRLTLLAL
jgi:uncharacterized protein YbjT (DUF2867 family)